MAQETNEAIVVAVERTSGVQLTRQPCTKELLIRNNIGQDDLVNFHQCRLSDSPLKELEQVSLITLHITNKSGITEGGGEQLFCSSS